MKVLLKKSGQFAWDAFELAGMIFALAICTLGTLLFPVSDTQKDEVHYL